MVSVVKEVVEEYGSPSESDINRSSDRSKELHSFCTETAIVYKSKDFPFK